MDRHLDVLGLLFVVAGFLALLVGVAMLSLGIGAAAIARSGDPQVTVAANVMAGTFVGLALVMLLWATANGLAGFALRRRRRWSRRFGLVLSAINVFALPFGTALAVYTVWVLLNDEARRHFRDLSERLV